MSHTIAQKYQVHIPWTTIVIVLLAVLAAAAVLVLINQPANVADETSPVSLTAPGAVALPRLETHTEILALTGRAPDMGVRATVTTTRHGFPVGTTLGPTGGDDVRDNARAARRDTRHSVPEKTSLD